MTDSNPTAARALAQAANVLRTQAREHKRAANHHRAQARSLMQRLAVLADQCQAAGIDLDAKITYPLDGD